MRKDHTPWQFFFFDHSWGQIIFSKNLPAPPLPFNGRSLTNSVSLFDVEVCCAMLESALQSLDLHVHSLLDLAHVRRSTNSVSLFDVEVRSAVLKSALPSLPSGADPGF